MANSFARNYQLTIKAVVKVHMCTLYFLSEFAASFHISRSGTRIDKGAAIVVSFVPCSLNLVNL